MGVVSVYGWHVGVVEGCGECCELVGFPCVVCVEFQCTQYVCRSSVHHYLQTCSIGMWCVYD